MFSWDVALMIQNIVIVVSTELAAFAVEVIKHVNTWISWERIPNVRSDICVIAVQNVLQLVTAVECVLSDRTDPSWQPNERNLRALKERTALYCLDFIVHSDAS